jgi:putative transposase
MPDHIHLILTPSPDISLEKAMQYIKGGFSFRLKSKMEVWERGLSRTSHQESRRLSESPHLRGTKSSPEADRIRSTEDPYSSVTRRDLLDPCPTHLAAL